MNLSAEHVEGLAAQTGFRPETLEKVIRLGELAADIGRHPLLSRVLVLKGGTALNLMFGSPARLSVDLDFNYIGQEDPVQMQVDRAEVERATVIITYSIARSITEPSNRRPRDSIAPTINRRTLYA